MSSRGRKRNDNLPPSRAREVQRAFRARRKQHLAALEERIDVLEAENARLRQMLALPPSDRQPLGRGPTGREPARRPPPDAGTTPDPNMSAGSPPPPISPGGGQHGRSPSAGAWPPPMQPPEWPPNPPHHPPPPGPSSAAVRAPSPYHPHLDIIPRPASAQNHGTEPLRSALERDTGNYGTLSGFPFNLPKQQTSLPSTPARTPY